MQIVVFNNNWNSSLSLEKLGIVSLFLWFFDFHFMDLSKESISKKLLNYCSNAYWILIPHAIFRNFDNTCSNMKGRLNFLVTHGTASWSKFIWIRFEVHSSISPAKSWFFLIALAVCVPMINRWLKREGIFPFSFFFFFTTYIPVLYFPFYLPLSRTLYSWNLLSSRIHFSRYTLVSSEMLLHSSRVASRE